MMQSRPALKVSRVDRSTLREQPRYRSGVFMVSRRHESRIQLLRRRLCMGWGWRQSKKSKKQRGGQ